MSRVKDIVTVVAAILASAGVLIGGVHWAVSGAVEPLQAEVMALRTDMQVEVRALRTDVHDLDVRLARVEEAVKHVDESVKRLVPGQVAVR